MRPAPAALLAALLGCVGAPRDLPAPPAGPAPGLSAGEVLALLHRPPGPDAPRVRIERSFLSRIEDGVWREIDADEALADPPSPDVRLALVALRTCSDWRFRDGDALVGHDADERASWFLLREGRLAAWDFFDFAPRCALENDFRPAGEANRATEKELLRFVAQRFPAPQPPIEIRFQRGHAYVEAGRLDDARRQLRSGDRSIDAFVASYRYHELPPEERVALDEREAELRRLRAELSVAIDRAERERTGPVKDPAKRFFRGLD